MFTGPDNNAVVVMSGSGAPLAEPSVGDAPPTLAVSPRVMIPAVLERAAYEYHLREFVREFQPVGHLEFTVVCDMARQTAAMEAWNEGVSALQRQRAQRLPELVLPEGGDDGELEDCSLAAAVSASAVHLSEHHGQRRSSAFYRALRTLLDLQERRRNRDGGGERIIPPNHFLTEAACEDYLKTRFEQGCYQCPRCRSRHGHYITSRRCWECSGCKRQAGLRAGTVAADSPLPLVVWFAAIRCLLWQPTVGTAELAIKVGISRSTTVRQLAHKILAAMAEENASELLAGLDIHYAQYRAKVPESGASRNGNTVPGSEGIQEPSGAAVSLIEMQG